MVKAKTSKKQKILSTELEFEIDESTFEERKPLEYLLNRDNILNALKECIKESDLEGILEIIDIYSKALERAKKNKEFSPIDSCISVDESSHAFAQFAHQNGVSASKKLV